MNNPYVPNPALTKGTLSLVYVARKSSKNSLI
jgi:hypothetical protein